MKTVYESFFEQSPVLLATIGADGKFVELSPAWTAALGYSIDALRSQPWSEWLHSDDRESALLAWARLSQGEGSVQLEGRCRHQDGSERWLSWTLRPSGEPGLTLAWVQDVSETKRLAAERAQALIERNRFWALAEYTTDFVGMADLQAKSMYTNPASLRMVGIDASEADTLQIADFHPPEAYARVGQIAIPYAAEHGAWSGDNVLRRRDGSLLPVSQVVMAMRDPSGQLIGFGTIMRDLSQIEHFKKLEHDLRTQQAALTEMVRTMSTPIIPITDQIVVMPIIGSMDSQRAEQFLEAALHGAELRRASYMIIDITGLRHIDTSVAGTLIKAASALSLLGARVVLTGIRAELARTLVGLGVELNNIITHSTLQGGIIFALNSLGQALGRGHIAAR